MKVVLQTPTQLVVHEGALKTVVLGTIFVAVGGGVITLRLAYPSGWTGNAGPWLIYLVGAVFVAVGIATLVYSADRRYVIDRSAGSVRIVVQRLAHRTTDEYPLADLKDVVLERSAGGSRQSNPFFRLVFLTQSGGRVPWTPYSTLDDGPLAACASAVRIFCGWAGGPGEAKVSPLAAAPVSGSVSGHPVATNWGCVGGFLAIFVAVGLGLFASEVYRTATWQPVSARILSTDIKAVRGDKGTSYTPVVRYLYLVNGRQYESKQVLPLTISASYGWAVKLRDRFRPGEIVTAYVSPNRPSSAFLVRELSLLPLLFVAVPLAMVGVLAWFAGMQRRQLAATVRYPVPVVDWGGGP
ncbi:MAG TPA: DUF3592 domain-containing protein [Gemmatimonadales bacterium]|nr:DUF3592 domain-containing protein [Gemmatimonadales bacterium]